MGLGAGNNRGPSRKDRFPILTRFRHADGLDDDCDDTAEQSMPVWSTTEVVSTAEVPDREIYKVLARPTRDGGENRSGETTVARATRDNIVVFNYCRYYNAV